MVRATGAVKGVRAAYRVVTPVETARIRGQVDACSHDPPQGCPARVASKRETLDGLERDSIEAGERPRAEARDLTLNKSRRVPVVMDRAVLT